MRFSEGLRRVGRLRSERMDTMESTMNAAARRQPTTAARRTISVIVPAYNSEATIGACLQSLLAQSRAPDEIVVVDDGSRDGTVDIVSKYPVRLVRLARNAGPGVARNEGAKVASGDILAFTDSDCVAPRIGWHASSGNSTTRGSSPSPAATRARWRTAFFRCCNTSSCGSAKTRCPTRSPRRSRPTSPAGAAPSRRSAVFRSIIEGATRSGPSGATRTKSWASGSRAPAVASAG